MDNALVRFAALRRLRPPLRIHGLSDSHVQNEIGFRMNMLLPLNECQRFLSREFATAKEEAIAPCVRCQPFEGLSLVTHTFVACSAPFTPALFGLV